MSFSILTQSADTPVVRTTAETAVDLLTAPLQVTAPEDQYVQKKFAAYASLTWAGLGLFVGEAWGNKRGRMGSKSFVPLFRG